MAKLIALSAGQTIRTPNNLRQAQIVTVSRHSKPNRFGSGRAYQREGVSYVVSVIGPPSELKPMVTDELVPLLAMERIYYVSCASLGLGKVSW